MKTTKKVRNFSQHLPAAIDKWLTRERTVPSKRSLPEKLADIPNFLILYQGSNKSHN